MKSFAPNPTKFVEQLPFRRGAFKRIFSFASAHPGMGKKALVEKVSISVPYVISLGQIQPNIQSDIGLSSPKHYFRGFFRVQIFSEEQPVCNILLP